MNKKNIAILIAFVIIAVAAVSVQLLMGKRASSHGEPDNTSYQSDDSNADVSDKTNGSVRNIDESIQNNNDIPEDGSIGDGSSPDDNKDVGGNNGNSDISNGAGNADDNVNNKYEPGIELPTVPAR